MNGRGWRGSCKRGRQYAVFDHHPHIQSRGRTARDDPQHCQAQRGRRLGADRRRQQVPGPYAAGRRAGNDVVPCGAPLPVRVGAGSVRRLEYRHPRRHREDHRDHRRRRACGAGLGDARGGGSGSARMRLRRRKSLAALGRTASGMVAERAERRTLGRPRVAGLRRHAAGVRTKRDAVAAGHQHGGPPRDLRTDRSLRQSPGPEGGHAAQPGAARMASARAPPGCAASTFPT